MCRDARARGRVQGVVGRLLLAAAGTVAELVSRYAALSYRQNYENDVGGRCDRPAAGVRQRLRARTGNALLQSPVCSQHNASAGLRGVSRRFPVSGLLPDAAKRAPSQRSTDLRAGAGVRSGWPVHRLDIHGGGRGKVPSWPSPFTGR
jgi:hypothetical protein